MTPNLESVNPNAKDEYLSYTDFMSLAKAEYLKILLEKTKGDFQKMLELSKVSRATFYRLIASVGGLPLVHSVQAEYQQRSNFTKKGPKSCRKHKLEEDEV